MSSINARVPPLRLMAVDTPSDGEIPSYQSSSGDFEWVADSGGTPAGSDREIQFNDGGSFGASSQLIYQTGSNLGRMEMDTGASATLAEIRAMTGHGLKMASSDVTASAIRSYIDLYGENDAPSGVAIISTATGGTVWIKTTGTGATEIGNETTNQDTTLQVAGNGTGKPIINLKNDAMAASLEVTTNEKLSIKGGTDKFVFDVSSATGGMTFPDGKELVSAEGTAILATGVTDGYVLTADGSDAAAWEAAGGGGAATLGELTDVLLDETELLDGLLIQTNSDGSAPTTGTLSQAENNIGIGANVFLALTSGSQNTVIGNYAADAFTTAAQNTIYGYGAGSAISTQGSNTLIGVSAGASTTSYGNTAVGKSALYFNTTTGYNTALGDRAGYFNLSDKNIFIGHKAAYSNPGGTGDNNIVIGVQSVGTSPSAGVGNVALGQGEHTSATGSNQLLISSGAGAVNWIRGDDAGACYQGDNATTWSQTSDRILKREIVDSVTGLDAINAIQVRNFRYIEKAEPIIEIDTDDEGEEYEQIVGYDGENRYDLDPEPLRVGVIAQELQEVLPDAVKENAHGHLIVNPDSINWALLKAVQELSAKVEILETAINGGIV